MTIDEIIKLAREADPFGEHGRLYQVAELTPETLTRVATLIRNAVLEEALALLPDEIDMVEHNPDEGPRMFCCGERVITLSCNRGHILTHNEECWYERMRALRDHDQENING